MDTRDRILAAAAALATEDPRNRLSVRAVAARAGVSTGSLRHHFPTQRALLDAVIGGLYDTVLPDGAIHDTTLPARDRLIDCLRNVVGPRDDRYALREAWLSSVRTFVEQDPDENVRAYYFRITAEGLGRITGWLTALVEEGALAPGDNHDRAHFLLSVANGLSWEQLMPTDATLPERQTVTLRRAVDAVFADGRP